MSAILIPSPTTTPAPAKTEPPSPTATDTWQEPQGCLQPSDDYQIVLVNGMTFNQRTLEMLEHAQSIYQGELEITGFHLTQGSYTNQVSASFGTHNGGGAVDISVLRKGTWTVLYDEIEPLINALRLAGFAAWLRDFDRLYPGSPIHIHAIAIGDRDLSIPAYDQISASYGYFAGFDGIPPQPGQPATADPHGGPVICQWMIDQGYTSSP